MLSLNLLLVVIMNESFRNNLLSLDQDLKKGLATSGAQFFSHLQFFLYLFPLWSGQLRGNMMT